jgi:hypothetical protein
MKVISLTRYVHKYPKYGFQNVGKTIKREVSSKIKLFQRPGFIPKVVGGLVQTKSKVLKAVQAKKRS